jgi:NAD(P)-dependent dehydrogenase (short-subunit alcohol dehydrogenase family)
MLVIGGTTEDGIGETIAGYALAEDWKVDVPELWDFDVTDYSQMELFLGHNGPYDYVVFCAGIQILGRLDDLEYLDIESIFQVNVVGYIKMMAAMARTHPQGAKVCAISSLAGRVPMTGSIGYCASKAALNHAVRCAARELKDKWQITAVVPATVANTPLTTSVDQQVMAIREWDREELLKQERIRQPFGRRVTKNEVAGLVMSLFDLPMTLTGSVIDLTGGA